ncbi:hypothetical protein [Reinekea sp.]|jgi:ribosomal protein L29|uniref:hypothetical protein n=1 Tax=Reinekea sp. TaxID=1970455 RepID=UPI003988E3BB
MSDSVKQLEEQLLALKKGLFLMSPRDRIRAMSTHETEDLIIELQDVADAALKSLESVKN